MVFTLYIIVGLLILWFWVKLLIPRLRYDIAEGNILISLCLWSITVLGLILILVLTDTIFKVNDYDKNTFGLIIPFVIALLLAALPLLLVKKQERPNNYQSSVELDAMVHIASMKKKEKYMHVDWVLYLVQRGELTLPSYSKDLQASRKLLNKTNIGIKVVKDIPTLSYKATYKKRGQYFVTYAGTEELAICIAFLKAKGYYHID